MKADSFRRENALTKLFGLKGKYIMHKVFKYFSVILFAITILLLNINFSYSGQTPITDDHINTIKNLFKKGVSRMDMLSLTNMAVLNSKVSIMMKKRLIRLSRLHRV